MKVLYLKTVAFDEKSAGGSIAHSIGMVNGLVDAGADVTVLGDAYIPLMRADQTVLQMKPFVRIPYVGNYLYAKRMKHAVKKWMKAHPEPYDMVYGRYSMFNDAFLLIKKVKKCCFMLEFNSFQADSYHDIFIGTARQTHNKVVVFMLQLMAPVVTAIINKYEKELLDNADLLVTVSQILKDDLIHRTNIPDDKIMALPNGVDPEMFHPNIEAGQGIRKKLQMPTTDIVVGYAGTFGNWHGIPELTEAIKRLTRRSDVSFLIMGNGALRPQMQEQLANCQKVHFTGLVPYNEMPTYLSACDILVISNSWNPENGGRFFGSPTKLFEYMAMGKAIVASRLEQIDEILTDNESAVLFNPGDAQSMESAMLRTIESTELRKKLGVAARMLVVENYTWKANAERVISVVTAKKS